MNEVIPTQVRMNPPSSFTHHPQLMVNRRLFFSRLSLGLGGAALSSLCSVRDSARAIEAEASLEPSAAGEFSASRISRRKRSASSIFS